VTAVPAASQDLLDTALDIARGAGDVTLKYFRSSTLAIETKGDGSPVTEGDKAAERYVRERIAEYSPDSAIVGEEEGQSSGTSGLTWYVDPIDGTKGFARGVPMYATLLAVEDEHGYAVGVIHLPATGETVWAGRGLGAFTNDGPARVSDRSELSGAFVTTSSVSRWDRDALQRVFDAGIEVRTWGDGFGWYMAATGRVEAMVELGHGTPWDFAPVPVIMSEAGGQFCDLDGGRTIHSNSAIASNQKVHDQLISVLRG
jgi:histidinol-phosphatase